MEVCGSVPLSLTGIYSRLTVYDRSRFPLSSLLDSRQVCIRISEITLRLSQSVVASGSFQRVKIKQSVTQSVGDHNNSSRRNRSTMSSTSTMDFSWLNDRAIELVGNATSSRSLSCSPQAPTQTPSPSTNSDELNTPTQTSSLN